MPRKAVLDYETLAKTLPDVARWHRSLLARNKDSARVDMNNLLRTLHEFRGLQPAALLEMTQDALDDFMQDFVAFYMNPKRKPKSLTGSTVSKYVDSIKSYLAWNRKELGRPLFIEGAEDNPVAEAQEIPSQERVAALLDACDLRTSFIVAMEAFAGVRPQVLGKSDASDGLRLKHFPELEISDGEVRFSTVPTYIRVPKHLSKTRKAYMTWLGPQGCKLAINYWGSRLEAGERLGPDSPAFVSELRMPRARIMRRTNIQNCVRVRMRKVGIQATTYILRSYFDNRLMVAESHGVSSLYRDFWMGHAGGLQTRYALRKERLPPDVIEDMRKSYTKGLPYLETSFKAPGTDALLEAARLILLTSGMPASEVDSMNLAGKTTEELATLIRAKTPGTEAAQAVVQTVARQAKQRIITPDQLESVLQEGWMVRMEMKDGRILVEPVA